MMSISLSHSRSRWKGGEGCTGTDAAAPPVTDAEIKALLAYVKA